MKKFLFTISALIAFGVNAVADDNLGVFEVADVDILPASGSQANIVVNYSLNAESSCGGYDFKITLPAGIAPIMDGDEITYTLGDCYKKAPSVVTGCTGSVLDVHVACGDPLQKQSGTLITIPVKATSALDEGTLAAQLHNADFIDYTTTFAKAAAAVDFDFVVSNTVILDETSTEAPTATAGVDVKVKRTISANNWNTICLPFAISAAQLGEAFAGGIEIADFQGMVATYEGDDCVSLQVNFISVSAMEANHPYLVKVPTNVTQFIVKGVDIAPIAEPRIDKDENKVKVGGKYYYFYNSFIGTYVAETAIPENNVFISGNKFYYATTSTKKMKAFRGYFDFQDQLTDKSASAPSISFVIDGNEATNIEGIHEAINDGRIYNLKGQHVENPTEKGVYIKNGKKFVIK